MYTITDKFNNIKGTNAKGEIVVAIETGEKLKIVLDGGGDLAYEFNGEEMIVMDTKMSNPCYGCDHRKSTKVEWQNICLLDENIPCPRDE